MRYAFLACLSLFLLLNTACRKRSSDSGTGSNPNPNMPAGTRIDSVTTRKVADNSLLTLVQYRYNTSGYLVQYLMYNKVATDLRYNAQNQIVVVSNYSVSGNYTADTLVYSANNRIVHIHPYTTGTAAPTVSRAYAFDSSYRLIGDTIYYPGNSGFNTDAYYSGYRYDSADNLQSLAIYKFDRNNPAVSVRMDSVGYTCNGNENPYYKYSFAIYSSSKAGYPLSKHTVVSESRLNSTTGQLRVTTLYSPTYDQNGLLRTQLTSYSPASSSSNFITELWYR